MGIFIPSGGGGGSSEVDKWADTHFTVLWKTVCNMVNDNAWTFNSPVVIGKHATDCSSMFQSLLQFDQNVVIPKSVTNCSNMLSGASNFSSNIIFEGNNIVDMSYMLASTSNYYMPFTVPDNVRNTTNLFYYSGFNGKLIIGNNVNASNMFNAATVAGAYNFNRGDIVFGENVNLSSFINIMCTSASHSYGSNNYAGINHIKITPNLAERTAAILSISSYTLQGTPYQEYTQLYPFDIEEGVTDCSWLINRCSNWNGIITLPSTAKNCSYMITQCVNYNRNITIPDSVENCSYMFLQCGMFNQNVKIPNNAKDVFGMFFGTRYNYNCQIPVGIKNLAGLFAGLSGSSFNQNISIPSGVENCHNMFFQDTSLNCNIQIPYGVKDVSNMFEGCSGLNAQIKFPATVTNYYGAFKGCYYMVANDPRRIINAINALPTYSTAWVGLFAGTNLNIPLTSGTTTVAIPGTVTNCCGLFDCNNGATSTMFPTAAANTPICLSLHNGIENCSSMYCNIGAYTTTAWLPGLLGCNFIPENAVNCHAMFFKCQNISGAIVSHNNIPEKVEDASHMFSGGIAYSFPWKIKNGRNLVNASAMFSSYGSHPSGIHYPIYGNKIELSNKLLNASSMFMYSFRNNSATTTVAYSDLTLDFAPGEYHDTNFALMFYESKIGNIRSYYSETTLNIPYGAGNVARMFYQCNVTNFPNNFIIPNTVTDACELFFAVTNAPNNIFLYANPREINVKGMVTSTTRYKNVYCIDVEGLIDGRICSSVIDWTPITNGYTNSYYKINLYNNIPPYVMPA